VLSHHCSKINVTIMLHYNPALQISKQWYSECTFSSVITAKYFQTPCCHRSTELFMDYITPAYERDPHVTDYLAHGINCCMRETFGCGPYLNIRKSCRLRVLFLSTLLCGHILMLPSRVILLLIENISCFRPKILFFF
jgi:hypothetical protein